MQNHADILQSRLEQLLLQQASVEDWSPSHLRAFEMRASDSDPDYEVGFGDQVDDLDSPEEGEPDEGNLSGESSGGEDLAAGAEEPADELVGSADEADNEFSSDSDRSQVDFTGAQRPETFVSGGLTREDIDGLIAAEVHVAEARALRAREAAHTSESVLQERAIDLRAGCSGQPPRANFWEMYRDANGNPASCSNVEGAVDSFQGNMTDLDRELMGTLVFYAGVLHLPMSVKNISALSPIYQGVRPITDFSVFYRILLTADITQIKAEHVFAALNFVGTYCNELVIQAPLYTPAEEIRTLDRISPRHDWNRIFDCLPKLKTIYFRIQDGEPADWAMETFPHIKNALATADLPFLTVVKFNFPPTWLLPPWVPQEEDKA